MLQLTKWLLLYCAILFLASCGITDRQSTITNADGVGIFGYSPVSYFEKNAAELGDASHSYVHEEQIYHFTSDEQIKLFKQDPKKYLPRYGRYCPYSLALGRRVAIDPTNFKIHNDQLLLFHSSVELSTINPSTQQNILEKADHQFKLLSF